MNLYFSGALTFTQVTVNDDTVNDGSGNGDLTDMGVGGSFLVGKEWWVSTNWGLGVAGMLRLASMKVTDSDARMTATAFSILFSATYN